MKKKQIEFANNTFRKFLLYTTPNGKVKVEIFLRNENIWLTQDKIAQLFEVQRPAITKHLKNIFFSGELDEDKVGSILEHTTKHGAVKGKTQTKFVKYYNLDAIICVGYRVNSKQAAQFRIWATQVLKEYIIKGFAMDDERLKNPEYVFGQDYFEEQLARIRDIRSSERRLYQKITDIYAQCSADYNPDEKISKQFFATVQNKLHFAVTGQTAAEIIHSRVSGTKSNMGLKTWKNAPKGRIRKTDAIIAKNYLNERELDQLNRIVTMYLDYAEMQAQTRSVIYMKDWVKKLNAFLKFNEKDVLQNFDKISHDIALTLAENEYEKFSEIRDKEYISDFDKITAKLFRENKK